MWGTDQQGREISATPAKRSWRADDMAPAARPVHPDTTGESPSAIQPDVSDDTVSAGDPRASVADMAALRTYARQMVREFLRAVPRSDGKAALAIVRPDGTVRLVTRAELTARIDRLRPRQRQIVRLGIEERWPRQRVCEYLQHISIKTFERDYTEALDILIWL